MPLSLCPLNQSHPGKRWVTATPRNTAGRWATVIPGPYWGWGGIVACLVLHRPLLPNYMHVCTTRGFWCAQIPPQLLQAGWLRWSRIPAPLEQELTVQGAEMGSWAGGRTGAALVGLDRVSEACGCFHDPDLLVTTILNFTWCYFIFQTDYYCNKWHQNKKSLLPLS